jgi:hypothetical protein
MEAVDSYQSTVFSCHQHTVVHHRGSDRFYGRAEEAVLKLQDQPDNKTARMLSQAYLLALETIISHSQQRAWDHL